MLNGKIIKDLINSDKTNISKKNMAEGVRYYDIENDILKAELNVTYIGERKVYDKNKIVDPLTSSFHQTLVDQKVGYIAGKPLTFSHKDKNYSDKLRVLLGDKFDDLLVEWLTGAANKAVEFVHPFINEEGQFDYILSEAEQIIVIRDTKHQRDIEYIIRYYTLTREDGKEFNKVEVWDSRQVTHYIELDSGEYVLDIEEEENPQPHYKSYNTLKKDLKIPKCWGKVPFIPLLNNTRMKTDLHPIKRYIDAYDRMSTGFISDINDIQMAIWLLRGYEGEGLDDFMQNLIKYKVISVGEEGGIESRTLEIPTQAREIMLKLLEKNIYKFGKGLNLDTEKFGQNPSGVALKFLYTPLDSKANTTIRKMMIAVRELLWYVTEFINRRDKTSYNYKEVTITVNKTLIINESEQIKNVQSSAGSISLKTRIANHPWVTNVEEELKAVEEEQPPPIDLDLIEDDDDE